MLHFLSTFFIEIRHWRQSGRMKPISVFKYENPRETSIGISALVNTQILAPLSIICGKVKRKYSSDFNPGGV